MFSVCFVGCAAFRLRKKYNPIAKKGLLPFAKAELVRNDWTTTHGQSFLIVCKRIIPSCLARDHRLSRGRPSAAFVFRDRRRMFKDRIDYAPGGFHALICSEQVVAIYVLQQSG